MTVFMISPYLAFRTFLMLFAGAAFLKLLEGHPVGILVLGIMSILAFAWLAYDLHMLAVAAARALGAS